MTPRLRTLRCAADRLELFDPDAGKLVHFRLGTDQRLTLATTEPLSFSGWTLNTPGAAAALRSENLATRRGESVVEATYHDDGSHRGFILRSAAHALLARTWVRPDEPVHRRVYDAEFEAFQQMAESVALASLLVQNPFGWARRCAADGLFGLSPRRRAMATDALMLGLGYETLRALGDVGPGYLTAELLAKESRLHPSNVRFLSFQGIEQFASLAFWSASQYLTSDEQADINAAPIQTLASGFRIACPAIIATLHLPDAGETLQRLLLLKEANVGLATWTHVARAIRTVTGTETEAPLAPRIAWSAMSAAVLGDSFRSFGIRLVRAGNSVRRAVTMKLEDAIAPLLETASENDAVLEAALLDSALGQALAARTFHLWSRSAAEFPIDIAQRVAVAETLCELSDLVARRNRRELGAAPFNSFARLLKEGPVIYEALLELQERHARALLKGSARDELGFDEFDWYVRDELSTTISTLNDLLSDAPSYSRNVIIRSLTYRRAEGTIVVDA